MIEDDFLALSKQLYPTGRAFWMPENSLFEKLTRGLNGEKIQFFNDSISLFDSLLPDNDNFSADDATILERIYGLKQNAPLTLDQRKAALYQAIRFPGQQARQHYLYLENELQAAGFNVYVYENIFPDGMGGYKTKTPYEVSGDSSILTSVQYGDGQYGDNEYGQNYNIKLANHINEKNDLNFNLAGDLSATFFVGGATLGSFANVPIERHDEFRQLLLKIKPASTVGFLFIHYV